MIAAIRTWLMCVCAVSMLLAVFRRLVPSGAVQRVGCFIGGLLLLVVMLRPFEQTRLARVSWRYSTLRKTMAARQEELEAEQRKALCAGIEERLEAYISEEAADRGLTLSARVRVEVNEDGVPLPVQAELWGEGQAALSAWLTQALNIPPERQVWHEDR